MKRTVCLIIAIVVMAFSLTSCVEPSQREKDTGRTNEVVDTLISNQPTPQDIDYSLERYNLTRRAYWVNGQREKADTLVCAVDKPLGYIVLYVEGVGVMGRFIVDGKVSSLNSFLSGNYYYKYGGSIPHEMADVDGSFGENDSGIFFFTTDGKYLEHTGPYTYSDIPFEVDSQILKVGG